MASRMEPLSGAEAPWVDIAEFCRAIGVPRVEVVDPYDLKEVERAIKEALDAQEASVIVAKASRTCWP